MKKVIKLLLSVSIMFGLVGCTQNNVDPVETIAPTPVVTASEQAVEMTLEIIVLDVDNNTELFNDFITVNGDVKTLADFLILATDLQVVLEDSSYGNLITSILGFEQSDKGPWWLYESTTNKSCVNAGMCDGVDNLIIENNDQFTFKLTSSF